MLNEEYFNELAKELVNKYQEYELYYLDEISKDVNEVIQDEKFLTLDDVTKSALLFSLADSFINRLNTKSKKVSTNTSKIITSTYKSVTKEVLKDLEYIADYNNVDKITSIDKNMQKILNKLGKESIDDLHNLSNTTALGTYLDIGGGNKQWLNTRQTYINIIDKAIIDASNGNISGSQALRQSLKSLGQQGLQYVYYDNGKPYRRNIVSSARMNIQDGMRAVAQEHNNYIGEKYGADAKEISAHSGCAPDHTHIQGIQLPNDEFEQLNNSLSRMIGTRNCRHYYWSILLGVSTPTHSKEELQAMEKANQDGWTDTNNILNSRTETKHYTLYEASQKLRQLENTTRKSLIEERILKNAGFTEYAKIAKQQATKYRRRHKLLVEALEPYGFRPDNDRFII